MVDRRAVLAALALWSGCGSSGGAPTDATDATAPTGVIGGGAMLSLTSALIQPPTSTGLRLTYFVTLTIDGCPTLDSSFGGTFRGVEFSTVSTGSFDGTCHRPTLSIPATSVQPTSNVIEVHDSSAAITATFEDGVLDVREATARDTPAWQFTRGGVVRYGWSHPADLVGLASAGLQWAGPSYPGGEVVPPHWTASGAVSASDELTFTAPSGTAYQTGSSGTAFLTAGARTGAAMACQGAAACSYTVGNIASHSAASL